MSEMKQKEEIHIFSAGENIVKTFKYANKKFHIARIIVFKEIGEKLDKDQKKIKAIENAIDELGKISEYNGIEFSVEKVGMNDPKDLMERIIEIRKKYQGDDLYFNLTSGRKVMSFYLYTMAIWIDGFPYYVDLSGEVIQFEIPKIQREILMKKPQYVDILRIVKDKDGGLGNGIRYKEVYETLQTAHKYDRNTKNGEKRKITPGTFSKWVSEMIEKDLLKDFYLENNHKVKYVSITNNGIYALKFFREL
ncbi:hypothetical protein ACNF42_07715 [Cuniculiplasma sp. SKW3]|uniref:hypothetical protein n=1 Tax=Cuniculiplasma sp. SKW3 TaxID=3400170 RepID=UPI003FCF5B63